MGYRREYDINTYDFARDLAYGEQSEAEIKKFLQAILKGTIEVKSDRYRNGKMVIETQQHRRNQARSDTSFWYDSGINVTTADWWVYVFVPGSSFVIVSIPRLKRFLRANMHKYNDKTKRIFAQTSDNPSRGWLLSPTEVMDLLINTDYDEKQHDQHQSGNQGLRS